MITMNARLVAAMIASVLLVGCVSGPSKGTQAPSFAGATVAGDDVSLAAMRGTVVILDFWAVW